MNDPFTEMVTGFAESASQPICKLIESIRAGVGLIYEPTHIKRIAAAESEALIIRAQGEMEVANLRQRAVARLTNVETRRQANIESVVKIAADSMPEECSPDPVDQDWMANFVDGCKDVGNEEVQELWGKLLAGEVAEPGSFSRRGLNSLKLMSSFDAGLFMLIGFRVWKMNDWPVLVIPGNPHNTWPAECPFAWHHIKSLADIGLVEAEILDEHHYIRNPKSMAFDFFGKRYQGFTNPLGSNMPYWVNFTSVGAELLPLVEQEAGIHDEYLEACDQCFSKPSWQLDKTSEARKLSVPDDLRDSLNLNCKEKTNSEDVN